jgi:hypothetical protein
MKKSHGHHGVDARPDAHGKIGNGIKLTGKLEA